MDGHFDDLALTIKAADMEVPYDLMDELLFLTVRSHLTGLLSDSKTEIFCFGAAPDNTADGQEELLADGVFYRIIAFEKNLGIDMESSPVEILDAFHNLVSNFEPRWTTIFREEKMGTKEITIELMYQEVF